MDEERIDGCRRFINKLWNAARFAQMHIKESKPGIVAVANEPDLLADPGYRTNATIRDVRKALDGYDFNLIASAIYQFTWHEFCDWYVEWIKADLFGDNAAARDAGSRRAVLCLRAYPEDAASDLSLCHLASCPASAAPSCWRRSRSSSRFGITRKRSSPCSC